MAKKLEEQQNDICSKFGSAVFGCNLELKIGISRNVKDGVMPIHGTRFQPEDDTSGWYIWAGESWSNDPDFYVPLCGKHLQEWAPMILPYLALEPGWRFLIAENYEDVWNDPEVLNSGKDHRGVSP